MLLLAATLVFLSLAPAAGAQSENELALGIYEELRPLALDGELQAYRHDDFWQCMDTLRELRILQGLWESGKAPWAARFGAAPVG